MLSKKSNFIAFIAISVLISSFILSGCMKEKKEPPKSMEQIKSEEGLPVEVSQINLTGFSKELNYFTTVSGTRESFKTAMTGDRIVKINAQVGDFVKEDQVIMEFPLSVVTLQIEQAKAALDNAEKLYNRMKNLYEAGESPKMNLDNAETQYLVSKRNVEQLNQMVYSRAPISGIIIDMPYRVGDVPKIGDPLFTVAQVNKMVAKINVSDEEYKFIRKGMAAVATWNGEQFRGRVTVVGLSMGDRTRSFPIEIEFDNPKNQLKSGVTVDIKLKIDNDDSAIVIERKNIREENGEKYVYVENEGKARRRTVTTGRESSNEVEITSGLNVGDKIITCCMNQLNEGLKLKVVNQEVK